MLHPAPERHGALYCAGWEFADWYASRNGPLPVQAPLEWSIQQIGGFHDRLALEKRAA